jgi:hypothetical protein
MASLEADFMEKFKDRPLHFAYAWPVKDPKRSKRKLPPPPFPGAEPLAVLGLLLLVGVSQTP